MFGRRATVGLSLLCALLFSAIAVQSASAVPAKNTTVYTCAEGGLVKDFKDPHCDEKDVGSGKYGHIPIGPGKKTEITVTNKTTGEATEPVTLKGIVAGVALEITCITADGKGSLMNTEPQAEEHTWHGGYAKKAESCTVNKPANCTVKAIEMNNLVVEGVEGLGPEENEMGVEYRPAEGKVLSTFTPENKGEEKCLLAGKALNLEGTMIATGKTKTQTEEHAGATQVFTNEMTSETLKLAGSSASFSAVTTVEMSKAAEFQLPISITTVT